MGRFGSLLASAHRRNQGGGEIILLRDRFTTPTDQPNIMGKVPDGENVIGSLWVDPLFATPLSAAENCLVNPNFSCIFIDIGIANSYRIEATLSMEPGGYIGITANARGYNNGWEFGLYPDGNLMEAYYNQGGDYAIVDSWSTPTPANTVMTVAVESFLLEYKIYMNDVLIRTIVKNDAINFNDETNVGIQFGSPVSTMRVTDFKVIYLE